MLLQYKGHGFMRPKFKRGKFKRHKWVGCWARLRGGGGVTMFCVRPLAGGCQLLLCPLAIARPAGLRAHSACPAAWGMRHSAAGLAASSAASSSATNFSKKPRRCDEAPKAARDNSGCSVWLHDARDEMLMDSAPAKQHITHQHSTRPSYSRATSAHAIHSVLV